MTQQTEKNSPDSAIAVFQNRCLNLLSPELQKKVRELEQVPLLPDWPSKTRGAPNLCLRSALFGVIKRGQRKAVKGETVAAVKGLNIRYTGWQLDQGDFDVLVQALHLQTRNLEQTTGNYLRFKVKNFLQAICIFQSIPATDST